MWKYFRIKEFIDRQGLNIEQQTEHPERKRTICWPLIQGMRTNGKKKSLFWGVPLLSFIDDVFMIETRKRFHAEADFFGTAKLKFSKKKI